MGTTRLEIAARVMARLVHNLVRPEELPKLADLSVKAADALMDAFKTNQQVVDPLPVAADQYRLNTDPPMLPGESITEWRARKYGSPNPAEQSQ